MTNYDYGFRIYNPSVARFLSVDPIAKDFPWLTPYQFAANRPIVAIDLDGLEPKDTNEEVGNGTENKSDSDQNSLVGFEPLTNEVFNSWLGEQGIFPGGGDIWPFVKIKGFAFEQTFLDATGQIRNPITNKYGSRPDALSFSTKFKFEFTMGWNPLKWTRTETMVFPGAAAVEVKAVKNEIGLTRQIKSHIKSVANAKDLNKRYQAGHEKAAVLIVATFADVEISKNVLSYATTMGVSIFQTEAYYNPIDRKVGFGMPKLRNDIFNAFEYDSQFSLEKVMQVKSRNWKKAEIDWNKARTLGGLSNE